MPVVRDALRAIARISFTPLGLGSRPVAPALWLISLQSPAMGELRLLWLVMLIVTLGGVGVVVIVGLTMAWRRHHRRYGDRRRSAGRVQHVDPWRMAGARHRESDPWIDAGDEAAGLFDEPASGPDKPPADPADEAPGAIDEDAGFADDAGSSEPEDEDEDEQGGGPPSDPDSPDETDDDDTNQPR